MTDEQIEQCEKGLTALRVTLEWVESVITAEFYLMGAQIERATTVVLRSKYEASIKAIQGLTLCVLVLKNGFTVVGESACVSPENFDEALSRKIARQKAIDKIWMLEGYLLKQELYEYPHGRPQMPGRDKDGR